MIVTIHEHKKEIIMITRVNILTAILIVVTIVAIIGCSTDTEQTSATAVAATVIHDTVKVDVVRYPMSNATLVDEENKIYKTAMRGWISLEDDYEGGIEIVVLDHPPQNSGYGVIFGRISRSTKITGFNVQDITPNNLFLLQGKEATVMGTFNVIGEGEGSQYHCREITFYLHENEKSPGCHWLDAKGQ